MEIDGRHVSTIATSTVDMCRRTEIDGRYVSTDCDVDDWESTVVTCPRIVMSSVGTRVGRWRSTVVMKCGVLNAAGVPAVRAGV
eukprot:9478582-Pyramimonas_sp.AAC.1